MSIKTGRWANKLGRESKGLWMFTHIWICLGKPVCIYRYIIMYIYIHTYSPNSLLWYNIVIHIHHSVAIITYMTLSFWCWLGQRICVKIGRIPPFSASQIGHHKTGLFIRGFCVHFCIATPVISSHVGSMNPILLVSKKVGSKLSDTKKQLLSG